MPLNHEQIFAAADALDAAGQAPTLAAVRKAVGGGSFTTISDAMAAWRARREAKKSGAAEPVPESLTVALNDFAQSVWTNATGLAHSRFDTEREALELLRRQSDDARQEAVQLADSLNADAERLQSQLETALDRAGMAEATVNSVREDLTEALVRAAGAEGRAAELEARLRDASEELARVVAQNEKLGLALTRLAGPQSGPKK